MMNQTYYDYQLKPLIETMTEKDTLALLTVVTAPGGTSDNPHASNWVGSLEFHTAYDAPGSTARCNILNPVLSPPVIENIHDKSRGRLKGFHVRSLSF